MPLSDRPVHRRLPIGAEPQGGNGVHFRVWAPAARTVAIEIEGGATETLSAEPDGYFSGLVSEAGVGTRYRFRLDSQGNALPDPVSRFQPDGPHGASQVVDPASFTWNDADWSGVPRERLVIYEMHIGTFTPEGTWEAASHHLPALAELGITAVEMMPIADFPGKFGWGYDGVDLFAPTRLYGAPDDLRRFVDTAHELGLAVILDAVYNHFGPDGNYLRSYAAGYFSQKHGTEWGDAINFDGPDSGPVREFFTANAGYWIEEYHFDGLRLDATHRIYDDSDEHILAAIGRRVRAAAVGRETHIAAENEDQVARIARSLEVGGYGLDGLWNDDFHHAARVALTGRREFYYRDFTGRAREFVAIAKHGYLFQGQDSTGRGTPAFDLPGASYVNYLENHDQIAHSGAGLRGHLLSNPGCWRAMTAYLLLSPGVPLLFQGQEFCASSPFLYFVDHQGEIGRLVRKGRAEYLAGFPSLASPEMQRRLDDPGSTETFRRCVLDHSERQRNAAALALHHDLIALRHEVFAGGARRIDAAILGSRAWVLRFFANNGEDDLLLIVNLGVDRRCETISEPLLAPNERGSWRLKWSSEHPDYGGTGIPAPVIDGVWQIPGHAAIVLMSGER
ncbi:MAG TPA: malto-oligosyltrehalose trehalohydrolase [Stellaceae bacterium]|nr:malto-oligosyltrehalose trehalohydrolase [Stellaceae bacterium]